MLKKAVVVVGSHYAGKSKTINKYLKKKLGIRKRQHRFWLTGKKGFVLSQSREEAKGFILAQSLEESGKCKRVAKIVRKYSRYDLLVFAARPSEDKGGSCLDRLKSELTKARYLVSVVSVIRHRRERYYNGRANKILSHLVR
jgi:hypothetical protein